MARANLETCVYRVRFQIVLILLCRWKWVGSLDRRRLINRLLKENAWNQFLLLLFAWITRLEQQHVLSFESYSNTVHPISISHTQTVPNSFSHAIWKWKACEFTFHIESNVCCLLRRITIQLQSSGYEIEAATNGTLVSPMYTFLIATPTTKVANVSCAVRWIILFVRFCVEKVSVTDSFRPFRIPFLIFNAIISK